ncbi:hypothetical protein ACVPPR_07430 [Dellaglioa sp. L3N]
MSKYRKDLKKLLIMDSKNRHLSKLMLSESDMSYERLRFLNAKGLISLTNYSDRTYGVTVTKTGVTYFQDIKEILFARIVWSVITPIVLAFITTLITIWIKGFF